MKNNPINFGDPTGHVEESGNSGTHGSLDCRKYPQYCNNGKPKSSDELLRLRDDKDDDDGDDPWLPEITVPDNIPCGGLLECPASFSTDLLQLGQGSCEFLMYDDKICESDLPAYSPLVIGYDWSKVDGFELLVDLGGIITDGGTLLFPPAAKPLQSAGAVIAVIGAVYQFNKVTNGEIGIGDISLSLIKEVVIENKKLAGVTAGKGVPVFGMVFNSYSILNNFSQGFHLEYQTTVPPLKR